MLEQLSVLFTEWQQEKCVTGYPAAARGTEIPRATRYSKLQREKKGDSILLSARQHTEGGWAR